MKAATALASHIGFKFTGVLHGSAFAVILIAEITLAAH